MSSSAAGSSPSTASLPQATIEQTIRTSKSLLWGVSIALSWTWGLGLFFSVQIAIQFGLPGLLLFALSNATGLLLFGFYTNRIAQRSGSASAFEKKFFEGAHPFRGAIFFYQFLAIMLTMFALLNYLVVPLAAELPLGISLPLTLLVLLSVTFFLGEEFDISRIRYSHAFLGVVMFVAAVGLLWGMLHILLPGSILDAPARLADGVISLRGAWALTPDGENPATFTYFVYYMVPVVCGFLVGPWLDLQQWQRAIQIRREGLSITGSYVCGSVLFFAILIFHGFLALSVWNAGLVGPATTTDGLFHVKDVIVRFFLEPDSGVGVFLGFYIAFLCAAIISTLDSGYIAIRWFLNHLLSGSNNMLFAIVPQKAFTSPLPYFFLAGAGAIGCVVSDLVELEYLICFYGSFLLAYQVIFLRRIAFGRGEKLAVPTMKMFAIGMLSIGLFAMGYFSLRSEVMAIGALVPVIYGIYATPPSREKAGAKAKKSEATAAADDSAGDDAVEGEVEPGSDEGGAAAGRSATGVAGAARVGARVAAAVAGAASASAEVLHDVADSARVPAVSADHVPADGKPAGAGVSTWFDGNWFVHRFTATYQDTNSVGNVYFAQYMMWVGKTRELFFNNVLPEFDLKKTDFFILTRSFEHKYLREAREFEEIEVRIKIADYNRKFSTLAHRVFNGEGKELGRGTQTLMFVSAKDYRLINIPDMCMRAFLNYVG